MKQCKGVSLIEVLVAMLVFSIGILGAAAMQSAGLKMASNSNNLSTAVFQAKNMADRMLANPQGVKDKRYDTISGVLSATPCLSNCTPKQIAELDAADWTQEIAAGLPSGAGQVSPIGTTGLYNIIVSWKERANDTSEDKNYSLIFMPFQP